jgi:hypothetical protein
MKFIILSAFVFLSLNSQAQESIGHKTVTECARDLHTKVWWDGGAKKAEKICTDNSQRSIDCAIELTQAKPLSYNFEKALKDCTRKRADH